MTPTPAAQHGPSGSAYADLVVTGAQVYVGDDQRQRASAVAVRGDRIAAVGTPADVATLIGPGTRVVEAPDGLVVAGFQDAHVHAPFAGRNRLHLFLNDLPGREAYLEAIGRYATEHPEVPWVMGGGWAMEHFPGGLPTKEDLDAVVPDRPVFLFNRDVHGAWVNSETLRRAGIDAGTPDPADGRIERDHTGAPTGMLHEGAAYSVNDALVPRPDHDEWQRAILNAQEHLHSLGITGWQDAWVTPATLRGLTMPQLLERGGFEVKITSLSDRWLPDVIKRDLYLFGLDHVPLLAPLRDRGLTKDQTFGFRVDGARAEVTLDGQTAPLDGARDVARAYLEFHMLGGLLAQHAEQFVLRLRAR